MLIVEFTQETIYRNGYYTFCNVYKPSVRIYFAIYATVDWHLSTLAPELIEIWGDKLVGSLKVHWGWFDITVPLIYMILVSCNYVVLATLSRATSQTTANECSIYIQALLFVNGWSVLHLACECWFYGSDKHGIHCKTGCMNVDATVSHLGLRWFIKRSTVRS